MADLTTTVHALVKEHPEYDIKKIAQLVQAQSPEIATKAVRELVASLRKAELAETMCSPDLEDVKDDVAVTLTTDQVFHNALGNLYGNRSFQKHLLAVFAVLRDHNWRIVELTMFVFQRLVR